MYPHPIPCSGAIHRANAVPMNGQGTGPLLPHRPRRAQRFPAIDYTLAGGYFVTICTRDRICSLAGIENGVVSLSPAGRIVQQVWDGLQDRFSIAPDEFVVMPNHVHGVVQLYGDSGVSLGQIIRAFKGASTRTIRVAGIQDFGWQANYYEHVIRNDHELERIRNYIISNPLVWPDDPENPERENKGHSSSNQATWAG
jgi:putative transposase